MSYITTYYQISDIYHVFYYNANKDFVNKVDRSKDRLLIRFNKYLASMDGKSNVIAFRDDNIKQIMAPYDKWEFLYEGGVRRLTGIIANFHGTNAIKISATCYARNLSSKKAERVIKVIDDKEYYRDEVVEIEQSDFKPIEIDCIVAIKEIVINEWDE